MRILILFLLCTQITFSQKFFTRTGVTAFKASVDAFEPVEAKNNSSTVILDVNSGKIATLLLIKAFRFRVALMQEHFNENYMDSDEFPKATFKGSIHDFNWENINSQKTYKISGILTIKGIEKPIETIGSIQKSNNQIVLKSTFSVSPADFNIKIPSIVRKKIANRIDIDIHYELSEKK
ncbi:YceI-like domain-containing protein [Tenacibaculum sp. 190130A14a]|uniref:YceI-like domain-containing protein n=1 Tax=Tenacibaculum polynesiense TaxID=3137857 RepID=A0ABM9PBC3_9FLAO